MGEKTIFKTSRDDRLELLFIYLTNLEKISIFNSAVLFHFRPGEFRFVKQPLALQSFYSGHLQE